jgi:predicted HD superfamily hydrolase involved in NAD metabolism
VIVSVYEQAVEALRNRLGDDALQHSERVARTAEALATIYGVDPEAARIAGLLHDWDREATHSELLDSALAADLPVVEAEEAHPGLLHARTAAAALRRDFPDLPDEVVDAVARHTVGEAEMTGLDKVVYLADMIEPARAFEGVDDLREAVGTLGLDELFAYAYQHSLLYLVRERRVIHPDTVSVWNAHVARRTR